MSDENENTQAEETQPQAEPKAEETQPIVEEQNVPRETSEEKDYEEPRS